MRPKGEPQDGLFGGRRGVGGNGGGRQELIHLTSNINFLAIMNLSGKVRNNRTASVLKPGSIKCTNCILFCVTRTR